MSAKTFVVAMIPEFGGLNATFPLSATLVRRGHRVIYIGPPPFREYVTSHGFGFQVFHGPYPKGRFWEFFSTASRLIQKLNHEVEHWLSQTKPDLVLLDPPFCFLAGPALKLDIPVVNLMPTTLSSATLSAPPVTSGYVPGKKLDPLVHLALWAWVAAKGTRRRLTQRSMMRLLTGFDPFSFVARQGGTFRMADIGDRLDVPELVAAPPEFDYPGVRRRKNRRYLGTCVDEKRRDTVGLESIFQRDRGKRLAFCSLGTVAVEAARNRKFFGRPSHHGLRFLKAVVDAFRDLPDWQLALRLPATVPVSYLGRLPPTVTALPNWPQLQVLEQADLLITHGGAGSVREAMHFGVPMLVFPWNNDQYGLAARVVFHDLGRNGDLGRATEVDIRNMISHVSNDVSIRDAVLEMKNRCRSQSQSTLDAAASFLEGEALNKLNERESRL